MLILKKCILYCFEKCDIYGGIKIKRLKSKILKFFSLFQIFSLHLRLIFSKKDAIYSLDPPLANRILFVRQAITNLVIGSGGECPQDYLRLFE